jgi:uncharacterized membrane protein
MKNRYDNEVRHQVMRILYTGAAHFAQIPVSTKAILVVFKLSCQWFLNNIIHILLLIFIIIIILTIFEKSHRKSFYKIQIQI